MRLDIQFNNNTCTFLLFSGLVVWKRLSKLGRSLEMLGFGLALQQQEEPERGPILWVSCVSTSPSLGGTSTVTAVSSSSRPGDESLEEGAEHMDSSSSSGKQRGPSWEPSQKTSFQWGVALLAEKNGTWPFYDNLYRFQRHDPKRRATCPVTWRGTGPSLLHHCRFQRSSWQWAIANIVFIIILPKHVYMCVFIGVFLGLLVFPVFF